MRNYTFIQTQIQLKHPTNQHKALTNPYERTTKVLAKAGLDKQPSAENFTPMFVLCYSSVPGITNKVTSFNQSINIVLTVVGEASTTVALHNTKWSELM